MKMKKYLRLVLISLSISLLFYSCEHSHQKAKYVFLFIGDGMGQVQVNAAEAYMGAVEGKNGFKHFNFILSDIQRLQLMHHSWYVS